MNTNDDKKNKIEAAKQKLHTVNTDQIASNPDYQENAWLQYTIAELGSWVSLLIKRAFHRHDQKKRAKDIFDAAQYLKMMKAHVDSAAENSTDECKAELKRLNANRA